MKVYQKKSRMVRYVYVICVCYMCVLYVHPPISLSPLPWNHYTTIVV